ncbi:MAG TPA: hypothetical protein VGJ21_08865 [Terracidiphilus sp.]|jgi:hypothetical protein
MKQRLPLVITSLLSILLVTLHLTGDALYARAGTPEASGVTFAAVPILALWLYGTLVLAEKRSGHIFMLVGSLVALLMPVTHLMAPGGIFRGQPANSNGIFLFVWTLHALGVTGMLSLMLAVRGLFGMRHHQ